jgi:hypothetical protein
MIPSGHFSTAAWSRVLIQVNADFAILVLFVSASERQVAEELRSFFDVQIEGHSRCAGP